MHWPESFQANRWIRTINLVLQAVLFLCLFAGINYLAQIYSWRFDLTRGRLFSLSAETRSYITNLQTPVRIVVTLERASDNEAIAQARRDVLGLLREYADAAQRNSTAKIEVEELDIYKQRRRAEALGVADTNVLLFMSGEKRRFVFLNDLYRMEGRERKDFLGERTFTAAILDVTAATKRKVYFLVGHGEMAIESVEPDRGLSQLRDALHQRNFDIDRLDLAQTRAIPEDADVILAVSPQGPLLKQEQELLRQWLTSRAGRLIAAIDPSRDHGMDDLLYDWGVFADDALILDDSPDFLADGGDLLLRRFLEHPITQVLIDNQIPIVIGLARPVRPDPGRPLDTTLKVAPLVAAAPSAWGERSYMLSQPAKFDEGVDLKGNPALPVAVVSERVSAVNLPSFSVRGGRLAVFGSTDFLSNNRIGQGGNLSLILNTINWAVDRDAQLNIPPRPLERFQLTLSQTDLGKLRLALVFGVPGAVALFGLLVYWMRRN
jgi:ABC-type uncharacterized transport system involved in gliding motility auxiliary subunit